jgi:P22 tail accessory factor
MAWSKRDIIEQAFSEIGKGGYEFDLQPDVLQSALRQLDAMMATFGGALGAKIGFSGGDGFGDVSQTAGVPDWAVEALYLNLAIRLAPSFGKQVSVDTTKSAKAAYNAMLMRTIQPRTRVLTGYAGGGSRYSTLPEPEEDLITETNNPLEFG